MSISSNSGSYAGKSPPVPGADTKWPTLSVIIPVFNEEETIREVLNIVRQVSVVSQIVTVDDASTDRTGQILDEMAASDPSLIVVHHTVNQGKGAAIVTGLHHAACDVVVIQDADLEYNPEQLTVLLQRIVDGADIVYGSRFTGSIAGMRLPNLIANKVLTFLANVLYGARITDEATCYKMFRRSILQEIPLRSRRFDFCPEVTAKVRKRGHVIVETPIDYRARTAAQGKKIRWTDGLEAIWALIKYRFRD